MAIRDMKGIIRMKGLKAYTLVILVKYRNWQLSINKTDIDFKVTTQSELLYKD